MREFINIILRESTTSSGDPEGTMQIGPLYFDQVRGMGQVPYNQNVAYMGFAVMMTPSQFLNLATTRDFNETSNLTVIKSEIKNGAPLGSPFLTITVDEDGEKNTVVNGHEGRTRMQAIYELFGDVPVLVHIFPSHGLRARNLTLGLISSCRAVMVPEKQRTPSRGPHFASTVWWMEQWRVLDA